MTMPIAASKGELNCRKEVGCQLVKHDGDASRRQKMRSMLLGSRYEAC